MGAVPPEHAGVASALNDTIQQAGAFLGSACGVLLAALIAVLVLCDRKTPASAESAADSTEPALEKVSAQPRPRTRKEPS
jgi:hypothetical protein